MTDEKNAPAKYFVVEGDSCGVIDLGLDFNAQKPAVVADPPAELQPETRKALLSSVALPRAALKQD